jgi:hypothetical protein
MDTAITIAIIGGIFTLIAALFAHLFTRQRELKQKELEFKFDRYKEFLSGFAEIGSAYKSYEAHLKMANALNTINLIGSIEVLKSTYELLDYLSSRRGDDYSVEEQNRIINEIVIAIRKDLSQAYKGEVGQQRFRVVSPGINPGEAVEK